MIKIREKITRQKKKLNKQIRRVLIRIRTSAAKQHNAVQIPEGAIRAETGTGIETETGTVPTPIITAEATPAEEEDREGVFIFERKYAGFAPRM